MADSFNEQVTDLRHRAHALMAAIVVLCGGAIAYSVSTALDKSVKISASGAWLVAAGVLSFFLCLAMSIATQFLIIRRDYTQIESWRNDPASTEGVRTSSADKLIWVCAWIGIASFLAGLTLFAVASMCVILGRIG